MTKRERELELIRRGLESENAELRRQLRAEQSQELFRTIAGKFTEAGLEVSEARDYLTSRPWREVTPDGVAERIEQLKQEQRRKNVPEGIPPTIGATTYG